MTETAPPARPDEDSPKRRQILEGARRAFMEKGFDASSMQDVARAAGVSKGTLYVYFDNKEAMFEALVLCECDRLQAAIREIASGGGAVGDELLAIARQMLTTLMQTEVLRAMRMVIGTGEKFPDLARKVYEAGPLRASGTLAEYLAGRVARGDLCIDDCAAASAEFLDLVLSGQQRRALLMMPPPTDAALQDHVARRVGLFLRVYGA